MRAWRCGLVIGRTRSGLLARGQRRGRAWARDRAALDELEPGRGLDRVECGADREGGLLERQGGQRDGGDEEDEPGGERAGSQRRGGGRGDEGDEAEDGRAPARPDAEAGELAAAAVLLDGEADARV